MAISTVVASPAAARVETPPSPRITALEKQLAAHERGAEDAFWQKLAQEGTPIIEDLHEPGHLLVTFVWRGDAATHAVSLVGPVSERDEKLTRLPGTSTFVRTVSLPDDGRFTYAFIVNPDEAQRNRPQPGSFHHDPLSKHPYLDISSVLELPRAPAQPTLVPHRGVATGMLWRHTIAAKEGARPRHLFVYTPPGFSTHGPAYPLLVAFDGEILTGEVPLPLILDELIAAKKIPPIVALLVGNVDRRRDLGADAAFTDLVALDLVPWMRAHYHATSDPRRTVISGMSLGGLASAYAAFHHPDVYGNVLSQSGSFWWGPENGEPEATSHDYATSARLPVRFWMEVGAYEFGGPRVETTHLASNRHLRDVLLARGYDVRYREFDGDHTDLNWRGTIADGIIALFATAPKLAAPRLAARHAATPRAPVDIGPGTRSGLPLLVRTALLDGGDAALAEAKRLLADTGWVLDEDEINGAGCTLLLLEHVRDSVGLLAWNTERFPKSANTWDSLAWAYWMLGDRAHAVADFEHELALDPKNPGATTMLREIAARR